MHRHIQYFKKLLIKYSAFIIAVILHAALIFSFESSESPSTKFSSHKSVISLQLGSLGSEAKLTGKKNPINDIHSTKSSPEKNSEIAEVDPEVGSEATGNAMGKGNGAGDENGFAFEDSIINFSEPRYPIVALKRGIEGSLRVRIRVSEEGVPLETIILNSSNHKMLDEAALKVIPLWRFQKRSGPSFYFVERTFVFKIKNQG